MEVNLEQLLADNPIRNQQLLIKTGVMLTVVILGFFLHPITHIDRECSEPSPATLFAVSL
jgi:Na+/H+ antiporter NhaD/arsenite permease-like protein